MSEVKRYKHLYAGWRDNNYYADAVLKERPDGDLVKYADYDALRQAAQQAATALRKVSQSVVMSSEWLIICQVQEALYALEQVGGDI